MLRDIRNCKQCGKDYEYGFMGAGTKYCSRKCRTVKNNGRSFLRYHSLKRKSRSCLVCDRDIASVGSRVKISKYCSDKCMMLHNKIKHGQKTVRIKIPVKIEVMKPVIIPVKDIPLLFLQ